MDRPADLDGSPVAADLQSTVASAASTGSVDSICVGHDLVGVMRALASLRSGPVLCCCGVTYLWRHRT